MCYFVNSRYLLHSNINLFWLGFNHVQCHHSGYCFGATLGPFGRYEYPHLLDLWRRFFGKGQLWWFDHADVGPRLLFRWSVLNILYDGLCVALVVLYFVFTIMFWVGIWRWCCCWTGYTLLYTLIGWNRISYRFCCSCLWCFYGEQLYLFLTFLSNHSWFRMEKTVCSEVYFWIAQNLFFFGKLFSDWFCRWRKFLPCLCYQFL